jgi:hypothetical protein
LACVGFDYSCPTLWQGPDPQANPFLSLNPQTRGTPVYFFLFVCIVVGLIALSMCIVILTKNIDLNSGVCFLIICGVLFVVALMFFWNFKKSIQRQDLIIKHLEQAIHSLEYENQIDTKVGDFIVCPHCDTPFEYISLNSIPPVESLKHCLSCGRQFFTSGLNSYPVRFK